MRDSTFTSRMIVWLPLLLGSLASSGCQHFSSHKVDTVDAPSHRHHCKKSAVPTLATVSVSGYVKEPGQFPIPKDGMTLQDALDETGGLDNQRTYADSENLILISLIRKDETHHFSLALIKRDVLINQLQLRPGDAIVVQDWLQTDLAKGRLLQNRTHGKSAATDDPIQRLFAHVSGESFGPDFDPVQIRKKFDAARLGQKWKTAAVLLYGEIGSRAIQLHPDLVSLPDPPEIENDRQLQDYADLLARTIRLAPISSKVSFVDMDRNIDWQLLRQIYGSLKFDLNKAFSIPVTVDGDGIYQVFGKSPKADLSHPNSVFHPNLAHLLQKTAFDENAIVEIERLIDGRFHTFVLVAKQATATSEASNVLPLPGDAITVTQSAKLPIVISDVLRVVLPSRLASRP